MIPRPPKRITEDDLNPWLSLNCQEEEDFDWLEEEIALDRERGLE